VKRSPYPAAPLVEPQPKIAPVEQVRLSTKVSVPFARGGTSNYQPRAASEHEGGIRCKPELGSSPLSGFARDVHLSEDFLLSLGKLNKVHAADRGSWIQHKAQKLSRDATGSDGGARVHRPVSDTA